MDAHSYVTSGWVQQPRDHGPTVRDLGDGSRDVVGNCSQGRPGGDIDGTVSFLAEDRRINVAVMRAPVPPGRRVRQHHHVDYMCNKRKCTGVHVWSISLREREVNKPANKPKSKPRQQPS
ncbi:uncharacterized protein LOC119397837 [Rhipicephalus sanguineus]|uniref:uncharacterized protein LOC119397837 n=1 Tax=Rhipicephalus sanguineus TaxID=34632 RepID=UPI0020C3AA1B|nr:uncharacterized protein LOC119397837 [Rhipicephalus sanguineus]